MGRNGMIQHEAVRMSRSTALSDLLSNSVEH